MVRCRTSSALSMTGRVAPDYRVREPIRFRSSVRHPTLRPQHHTLHGRHHAAARAAPEDGLCTGMDAAPGVDALVSQRQGSKATSMN